MGAIIQADLARLAVDDQAEAVLRVVIELYAAGDQLSALRSGSYLIATRRFGGRLTYPDTGTRARSFVPVLSTSPLATMVRTPATRS